MDKFPHGALYVNVLTKADDSFRHNPSPPVSRNTVPIHAIQDC